MYVNVCTCEKKEIKGTDRTIVERSILYLTKKKLTYSFD